MKKPLHGLLVVLVLLALDDDLFQSVDELLPSLLGEGVLEELLGLSHGVVEPLSVLLRDSLLELLGFASGLVLGFTLTGCVSVSLGLGGGSLLLGSASKLVLLLREGSVGVSRVVEVLGVRLQLALGITLGLLFLLLGFLLLLLSLVVCLSSRSRVAILVNDPVCQRDGKQKKTNGTYWALRGSSLGLYRISLPPGPLSCSSGVSLVPSRLPSGPIHSLLGASWSALSRASWSGLTFSATLTAPLAKRSRPMTPKSETIFRASELVMKRVMRVRRWAAADSQYSQAP